MPTDKGSNAALKVASLVAGIISGAGSIDDVAVSRHGGIGRILDRAYDVPADGVAVAAACYDDFWIHQRATAIPAAAADAAR